MRDSKWDQQKNHEAKAQITESQGNKMIVAFNY